MPRTGELQRCRTVHLLDASRQEYPDYAVLVVRILVVFDRPADIDCYPTNCIDKPLESFKVHPGEVVDFDAEVMFDCLSDGFRSFPRLIQFAEEVGSVDLVAFVPWYGHPKIAWYGEQS